MDPSLVSAPAIDAPEVVAPAVVVALSGLDRSVLGALAYGRSLSSDVTAVHVASDEIASRRIRDWWRQHVHDVSLDGIAGRGSFADDVARYLDERGHGSAGRPVLVIVPSVATRPRLFSFVLSWRWLSIARRLARRPWTSVVAAPYRV